ncbi:MAG: SDR family NAD(P)-dependent oxidoreductase [Mangrovibacterium sp.]
MNVNTNTTAKSPYTLITGASTGLGKELALECARRGMNLILISLPGEGLPQLSRQIASASGVRIIFRETDLTRRASVEELTDWIKKHFALNMLINNAGVGGSCLFTDSSTDYLDNIIQLNISAMVRITRLLTPLLRESGKAYILNVSSLAAFSPVPFKTVYPASKAFIYHFSLGLRAELKSSGIHVSVLNPGPIITNADVSKRINRQSEYVKLSVLPAAGIARIAVNKLLRKRAVIIPGFFNRLNAFVIRLTPVSLRIQVGTSIFRREMHKKQVRPKKLQP